MTGRATAQLARTTGVTGAGPTERTGADPRAQRRPRRALWAGCAAFSLYLLVSVVLWWQVWTSHPTSVTTCGCGDTALFLWFVEWPAYALAHGHNPLFSTALFHPAGINLVSNTSALAVGIVLAPVTWLFGPVATLNVASTLGPAASALAMFVVLRRWVRWAPAAFVGGLVFGFSPFVVVSLAGAHLMTGVLFCLPLMLACLDELLIRQNRKPAVVGAWLGLLVVLQFFIGTEILTIAAMSAACGIVVLVVYALLSESHDLARRARYAARGLGVTVVVAGTLLAYPLWFALAGPDHFSGRVWPALSPRISGASLSNYWQLSYSSRAFSHEMQIWGGYQGPPLPQPEYIGLGLFVVTALGALAFRRDRRLWFFGVLGVVAALLSLGAALPWAVLQHFPLIESIIPARFAAIVTLCAAVMLAVVVDRTRTAVRGQAGRSGRSRHARHGRRSGVPSSVAAESSVATGSADAAGSADPVGSAGSAVPLVPAALAALAGLAVGAVAVVPMAGALESNTPVTAREVAVPRWFSEVGPKVGAGTVVLAYPAPFSVVQSAMAWQAVDSLRFAMAGGGGPGSVASRAGKERAGLDVIRSASLSLSGPPPIGPLQVTQARQALAGWRVNTIVVPLQTGLPAYDRGTNPALAIGLFTAATGRAPLYSHDAWVWTGSVSSSSSAPPVLLSEKAFARCTTVSSTDPRSLRAVPKCVIDSSHR